MFLLAVDRNKEQFVKLIIKKLSQNDPITKMFRLAVAIATRRKKPKRK